MSAKAKAASTIRRIGVRSARVNGSQKLEKSWKYTSLAVRSMKSIPFSCLILTCSREGDRIVLEGEGDQVPDQEPGDIIFGLVQTKHDVFTRSGADLSAEIEITLAEALCGFSKVVVKHLDGRGLHIQHPQPAARVLEPGQVIKVGGEGMPHKKSEQRGDLYLIVKIKFPDYGWLETQGAIDKLKSLLPKPQPPIQADVIDDVSYDETATMEDFGGVEGHGDWVDEDEEGGQPQCAQQ